MIDSSNISTVSVSNESLHTNVSLDMFDCSFRTVDRNGKEQILKFIDEGNELIFIHFNLHNFSNIFPFESGAKIYKMLNLVRTAGSFGDELLLLHPQFEQLSMGTLMFGVEHVEIQLSPMSSECLFNLTEEQVHTDLITFATREFRLLENLNSNHRICSMHVKNINERADFYYECCFRNVNFTFECRTIEEHFWTCTKKYEVFSQTVTKYILSNMSNLHDSIRFLKNVERKSTDTQEIFDKYALQLDLYEESAPSLPILVKNNEITLSSQMPFLFFDDHGKPFVTQKDLSKICSNNFTGAPGTLWENYKKAFIHFVFITLFLLLVATIVLAFSQAKGVTGTYLALATLGGGLIPFILRRYLFKSNDLSDFRTDYILFCNELKTMITKEKL
ncbi:unnamed protein product [Mytilus edulis]|uniref:Uncharacterized protein n=1 Tax=Mytilus edulis TaxID=6550 RepID=A0A8S3PM46_MYTED|nr:unnamed protein product [Mytilus edulis]